MAKVLCNYNNLGCIMKRACVFPGQGSQVVGMCKDVVDNFQVAKTVMQEVDDALSQNLSNIILSGPAEELILTENAQPALMACSIAILKVIEEQSGKKLSEICDFVAGHSLGEFTALTAAGVFSLSDCAKLLKIRGKAMQEAVPLGHGAMVAILGANMSSVQEIVEQAGQVGICQLANDNSIGQQVLSGTKEAVEEAVKLSIIRGYKTIKLNVSAPFHCQLMKQAQDALESALETVQVNNPSVSVIANFTAKPISDKSDIKELLVKQVTGMVRWRETILELSFLGVDNVVEIGSGKVLTGLFKKTAPSILGTSIQNSHDIENFIQNL
jgi:[acyl-carrier-protein] S-malonyltransferase